MKSLIEILNPDICECCGNESKHAQNHKEILKNRDIIRLPEFDTWKDMIEAGKLASIALFHKYSNEYENRYSHLMEFLRKNARNQITGTITYDKQLSNLATRILKYEIEGLRYYYGICDICFNPSIWIPHCCTNIKLDNHHCISLETYDKNIANLDNEYSDFVFGDRRRFNMKVG